MNNTIYFPCKALRPYINYYRVWQQNSTDTAGTSLQDYPRTIMDMLFLFEGKVRLSINNASPFQLASCSFIGQFDKNYRILPEENIRAFNIRFKPNGVYPLTKTPLIAMLNNHLPLVDLMGKQVIGIHQQLQEQTSDAQKVQLVENYLLAIYQEGEIHHKFEHAMSLIRQSRGLIKVKTIKEKLHISYKSLDRWFQKNTGLSPKRFIQLTRFNHIIEELEGQQSAPDWMQFVADYNFYDQAHFIKEFKQFAGICPSGFPTS